MSKQQFDPGHSSVTPDYVHLNDSWLYSAKAKQTWVDKVLSWSGRVFGLLQPIGYILNQLSATIDFAARNHVLLSWELGNLSWETGNTLKWHRKWIWYLWHRAIPNALFIAERYAYSLVQSERRYRINGDNAVLKASYNFTYQIYSYLRRIINQDLVALESLIKSDYVTLNTYIGQVLQAAQNAAQAAYNNSVTYTNHAKQQLIQYANQILQQSETYADKQAKAAHDSAVHDSNLFTSTAIAALVAGVIADLVAQEGELAAAEAVDAAWITGVGKLLEDELGKFGSDLKGILNVAFVASMLAYVAAGVTDAKDTGDVTADVLIPILTPISDGVKSILGVL